MLQFLPYAMAAYGGYRGYKGAKDSGASGIQRLLGGVTGAAAGYYGGKGVLAGGSISNFIPEIYLKLIASLTFLIIGSRLIFDSLNK